MKNLIRTYGPLLLFSGLIILADQLTKSWVRETLDFGAQWAPWPALADFVRIVNWQNTGVAFGMFQGLGPVFAVLSAIVSVAILVYYPRVAREDWLLRLALGLQLAGAVGNLIDRVAQGYVTDFIYIGTFPVFNIADASITVGVGVLILAVWLQEKRAAAMVAEPGEADEETGISTHIEENG